MPYVRGYRDWGIRMGARIKVQALTHRFDFPVGYHSFTEDRDMNYQLNRWHSMGYWSAEDTRQTGKSISDRSDWKDACLAMGERLQEQDLSLAAAFAYRAAEFLTHPHDPDKIPLYDEFHRRFYAAVLDKRLESFDIPYQGRSIPALRIRPIDSKGTIVCHGGLDSFMEEFYSTIDYFVAHGYEVIVFDGPGQGAALRRSGLTITHEWERPVTAVLDYFQLDDVTLIGVSLGGYLALRAAAFDDRITRVIPFDIFIYDQHGRGLQGIVYRLFLRFPGLYNWVARTAMKRSVAADHVVNQWMFITGVSTPAEWNALVEHYSVSDIAHLVRQDVLLLAGAEDHMVPIREYQKNVDGLLNARSVSGRIFTAEEHAQNHCQMGNLRLALDTMLEWIDGKG